MRVTFVKVAFEDFEHWVSTDRKMALRIMRLIGDIQRDPFNGLGKPEPLKGDKSGYWSRRINDEHRLVYSVAGDTITIVQARYHY
ncbi:Txe/YoeB family addiction module toxin [Nocardia sp. NBC_00565]|uniref:Txe/YoeB family addiction module toxin n=1 Tax=unclassified Nocardia TaxID=2637762 RepID=UPI002E818A86|nr:Txe/YoeB family addiction module toxin [Nocardia sp. NBC_00565]WUC00414.1 Txe/YoeB family addiction module toxin [Nocardia sp. NBC_00565]